MTSMKEIVMQVRSGKLNLPTDKTLRSLVLYSVIELGFNPVQYDFSKDFEEEQGRQEKELAAERERADKERKKRVDELTVHLLDFADEAFEFEVLQTKQRLSVKTLSITWPLPPETKCPKSGKRVETQEPLLSSLLREMAELAISGHHKRNPSAVDVALFLSKHTGPYDKWVVTCGETRCTGITGTRCNEMLLRLVQKNQ